MSKKGNANLSVTVKTVLNSITTRYSLSLILASTLIQLSKTSWLDESWGLGHIHVLHGKDGTFVTEQAYVSRKSCTPYRIFHEQSCGKS